MAKNKNRGRLSLASAILWVLTSVLLVTGSSTAIYTIYYYAQKNWMHDDTFNIVAIVQTGPTKEALPTILLAQLMDLSEDRPTNLYRFDTKQAEKKLMAFPVIQNAKVKKIKPGTIYIDYNLRTPAAYLTDYVNTAIDHDGVIFPFYPYYTPKNLPELYLGINEENGNSVKWGNNLSGDKLNVAWELLTLIHYRLAEEHSKIKKLDLSRLDSTSYGNREIIVVLEDQDHIPEQGVLKINEKMIRLNSQDYSNLLTDYHSLFKELKNKNRVISADIKNKVIKTKPLIVDLRVKDLAFVKEVE
jgi:hypothetical protein